MKKKILAVDDNSTNLMLYEELLEDHYLLETAASGEEALVKAFEFMPDITLLDIMMPGLNGYEVCSKLRASNHLEACKIILVSAKNTTEDRIIGYENGADDYLIKPFNEDELNAKLQVYLQLESVTELNRFKSDVVSIFSHETRTPLAGIMGPLQMLKLKNDSYTAEERLSWYESMEKSANGLLQFIEKALLLAQLRSGQYPLSDNTYSVSSVVLRAIDEQRELAASKDITLKHTDISDAQLCGDEFLLQQCISEMIKNAIEHSTENASVVITASNQPQRFIIAVRDGGAGIDWKYLPHVFDSFTESELANTHGGHGISLAIAKEVIELHNGAVEANSSARDGTEFLIELPKAS